MLGTDDCGIDRVCMPCVQGTQAQEAVVSLTLAVSVWKADLGHTKWLLSALTLAALCLFHRLPVSLVHHLVSAL